MKTYLKNLNFCFGFIILSLFSVLWAQPAAAEISEPDFILYGKIASNETPYATGTVSLSLNNQTIVQAAINADTGANRYILRIPMDGSDPRNMNAAKTGELAKLYFNTSGYQLGQVVIGGKGKALELNFDIPDSDGDGLSDADELAANTNKDKADTDGDKLTDKWELTYGFDAVNTDNSAEDSDMDGLTNLEEQTAGTHPILSDTDTDGCDDGVELAGKRDPLVADPEGDINQNCVIDLKDISLSLEILSQQADCPQTLRSADVNEDGIIDLSETLFSLQKISDNANGEMTD